MSQFLDTSFTGSVIVTQNLTASHISASLSASFIVGPVSNALNALSASYVQTSGSISLMIKNDNGIETGIVGDIIIPTTFRAISWTLVADIAGSIVIDIWKATYDTFPPTGISSITAGDKPTLSSELKNRNTNITSWDTTLFVPGDILRFNIDSATTVTNVLLTIEGIKS